LQNIAFEYKMVALKEGREFQGDIVALLKDTNPTMDEVSTRNLAFCFNHTTVSVIKLDKLLGMLNEDQTIRKLEK